MCLTHLQSLGDCLDEKNSAAQKVDMNDLRDNIIIVLAQTTVMTLQLLNVMYSRTYCSVSV
jgi:hypothetical protein